MIDALQFVKGTLISAAMVVATNVPEADYPAWLSTATYGLDVRVTLAHKVYQSVQANNIGKTPATETQWWKEVGPTNRMKAFDTSNSSQTVMASDLFYEIKPGVVINACCLLNMQGATAVRVRMTDPAFGLVYDTGVLSLRSVPDAARWYAWFFGKRKTRTRLTLLDLPSYPNAVVRVEVFGAPRIGVLMLGQLVTVGSYVLSGVRLGIKDFSKDETNIWGDEVLSQGKSAKRASCSIVLENDDLDYVFDSLESVRSTPCLWLLWKRFNATCIYGRYSSFEILIPYADYSECEIDFLGMT